MSKSIESTRMPSPLRAAVKEALEAGWTAKRGGNGWKMRSPKGSQWMHIAPGTNIPEDQARSLRSKMTKAAILEGDPEFIQALEDPTDGGATITCRRCEVEFLTPDGYEGHKYGCKKAEEAALAALQAVEAALVPEVNDGPPEGRAEPVVVDEVEVPGYVRSARMPTPTHRPDIRTMSPTSDMLNIKEEVVAESTNAPRGGYTWKVVKPGLARALYEVMKSRSQHKGEALSTYVNVVAELVSESGIQYTEPPPGLDEAQVTLSKIALLLGVDTSIDTAALQAENEQLRNDLSSLKELLTKY